MEIDTVTIGTTEYNELRDFKRDIKNEKSFVLKGFFPDYVVEITSNDKVIIDLIETNNSLHKLVESKISNRMEIINKIKKMSLLELYKFRSSPESLINIFE